MSSSALKHELASHIYQYLCHEAQHSDLSEAAKESLTAASECIEQAYKLNVNNRTSAAGNSNPTNNTPSSTTAPTTATTTTSSSGASNLTLNHKQTSATAAPDHAAAAAGSKSNPINSTNVLPDELLRIFTRHKEYLLAQQVEAQERGGGGGATASSSSSSQHPISQLPMTTRKKLSHLRAQIKRQASKAARSRLEKRSSVSGTGNERGAISGIGHHFGLSLDVTNSKQQQPHHQHHASDGYDPSQHHHHHEEIHHQPNSTSSTDSPTAIAHSGNTSTSSPAAATSGQLSSAMISSSGNQQDPSGSNLSPGQLHESGPSSSGDKAAGGKHGAGSGHLAVPRGGGGHHRHKEFGVSVHQKNFKQKLIALLKKFRTDGSGFDSEEQYREALERELMKAAAGRGSRAIEELLEEDIDVEEESGSELEDWDNISESSTPKPSLRPFFSSTTLDKI